MHYENLNLENIEGEVWLPTTNLPNGYMVSNLGRVKALSKTISWGKRNPQLVTYHEHIMKQTENSYGYLVVMLTMPDGDDRYWRVHRLVANAFISNPEHKPTVNHKNGIKIDNTLDNLEWMTISENTKHAYDNGLMNIKSGSEHAQSKTVYHYNLQGELIATYGSCGEAHRLSGVSLAHINKICRKEFDFVGENVFSYEELPKEYFNREFKKRTQKERVIIKYDLVGVELEITPLHLSNSNKPQKKIICNTLESILLQ